MRTRERNSLKTHQMPCEWKYYQPDGTYIYSQSFLGNFTNGIAARITDHNNGKQKSYTHTTRVDHVVCEVATTAFGSSRVNIPGGQYFITGPVGAPAVSQPYDFPWGPNSGEANSAAVEAHNFFASGCQDNKVMLYNFIVEIPSAIRLIPDAVKLMSKIKDLKRLHKNFSDGTLSYQFGALPLVSDIMNTIEALKRLDDHVTWLKENSGKPVGVEFKKSLKTTLPSDTPVSDSYNWFYRYREFRVQYKAFATIIYDTSTLSDLAIKSRSLQRFFGLDNLFAALWEGIPFSFVVDWFLDVGSFFERCRIPINIPHKVLDIGQGVRSYLEYDVFWSSLPASMGNPLRHVCNVKKTAYCRVPGIDTSFSSLDLTNPTIKQWLLGALLGLQKL